MYYNGVDFVIEDVLEGDKQAVKWFQKAAEQGQVDAQNNLGVMYSNGQGVLQDYEQAVEWYRKAAEQGYTSAQNNLGVMYQKGQGVLKDPKQAIKWYRRAAEEGEASAEALQYLADTDGDDPWVYILQILVIGGTLIYLMIGGRYGW